MDDDTAPARIGEMSGADDAPDRAIPSTRYPGYDVLDKWRSPDWDAQTRAIVRQRVEDVPPLRFFTPPEAALLTAVVERLLPQQDREPSARIPIVPWIDEKLHHDWRDGYRYEEMPPLREAWRLGIQGIEDTARLRHARRFVELAEPQQSAVLASIQRGEAAEQAWTRLSARRFFRDVLCLTVVKLYYAHPSAWSEIGYSGPSSPRGHVRNWMDGIDPWDAPEECE